MGNILTVTISLDTLVYRAAIDGEVIEGDKEGLVHLLNEIMEVIEEGEG